MQLSRNADRRTVLKTLGAGVVGGAVLPGTAAAGDTGNNRRQDSFTWAAHELWEMGNREPPKNNDSDGNEEAHEPIFIIKSMAGTGVPGSDHSPHFEPANADHVITFEEFNPQWHVHLVLDRQNPFVDHDDDPSTDKVPNLVRRDQEGRVLTSVSRIRAATNVKIFETDVVFTCPVRPHQHK